MNLAARLIANYIATDTVYQLYSWGGTIDKKCFNTTFKELLNVEFAAVTKVYPSFTLTDLANFYKEFLKHAKFRLLKKK